MTQENTCTILHFKIPLSEYRVFRGALRKVGEGTGTHVDLDKYDDYYLHLVLWDEDDLEIVGAYRIAECSWILSWLGKEGLYMNELCQIDDDIDEKLLYSIELGRSFIQPKLAVAV